MVLGNLLCYKNVKRSSAKLHLVNPFLHTSKWSFGFANHELTSPSSSANYHFVMVRRTYEFDATKIEDVDDFDDLVADKREA